MHRLRDRQAFGVGPGQRGSTLSIEAARVDQADELHVACTRSRLRLPEQVAQWQAHPGNDHRPAFDAAQSVDAFLRRKFAQQPIDVDDARARDFAFDAQRPGMRVEVFRQGGDRALVRRILVEVVVAGDLVPAVGLVVRRGARRFARPCKRGRGEQGARLGDEPAALEIHAMRRELAGADVVRRLTSGQLGGSWGRSRAWPASSAPA